MRKGEYIPSGLTVVLKSEYEKAKAEGRVFSACGCESLPDEIGYFHPDTFCPDLHDFTGQAYSALGGGELLVTYGHSEFFNEPGILLMYNHEGCLVHELFELRSPRVAVWFETREEIGWVKLSDEGRYLEEKSE